MNSHLSKSAILPFRPSTERVFTAIGNALRMALRALLILWRDHNARRREAREFDALGDVNEHMLRDIGAPDRLIAHAAARSDAHHWRGMWVQLSASVVAAVLIATATPTSAVEATYPQATSKARTQGQMVGVFTGEYVDGAPVYRLPSVVVTTRKSELARMEREETLACIYTYFRV